MLLLVGTNLFTLATTRYWTTRHVLTQAQERMDAALQREGLYDQRSVAITLAIHQAGGMYHWWNDGLLYWGAAVVLTLLGLGVTRYQPRTRQAS